MFEGGIRERLIALYPDRAEDIHRLGCDVDNTSMPEGFAT
jgi:hypothetical protein